MAARARPATARRGGAAGEPEEQHALRSRHGGERETNAGERPPRAVGALPQISGERQRREQREERCLESSRRPAGVGRRRREHPAGERVPGAGTPAAAAAPEAEAYDDGNGAERAGDAEHLAPRHRVEAERQHPRHHHGPQEVGVTLDLLPEVPDQLPVTHQIVRVAETDEGVVADEVENEGVADEQRRGAAAGEQAPLGSGSSTGLRHGGE